MKKKKRIFTSLWKLLVINFEERFLSISCSLFRDCPIDQIEITLGTCHCCLESLKKEKRQKELISTSREPSVSSSFFH